MEVTGLAGHACLPGLVQARRAIATSRESVASITFGTDRHLSHSIPLALLPLRPASSLIQPPPHVKTTYPANSPLSSPISLLRISSINPLPTLITFSLFPLPFSSSSTPPHLRSPHHIASARSPLERRPSVRAPPTAQHPFALSTQGSPSFKIT